MRKRKSFDELTFKDDYMFFSVMSDPSCLFIPTGIIEMTIRREIEKITLYETQDTEKVFYDVRGVRYDVYFVGDDTHYVIEMQNYNDNLIQRSRVYHDIIDMKNLNGSEDPKKLKNNVVIFICTKDYINKGKAITSYTSMWRDDHTEVGEGRDTYFLTTCYESGDENVDAFSKFVNENIASNGYTEKIDDKIKSIKKNDISRKNYMRFQEIIDKENEKVREEAITEGKTLGAKEKSISVCENLLQNNVSLDIISSSTGLSLKEIKKIQEKM